MRLALADGDDAKLIMAAETDAARSLGIFGSPTFTVGRELFWGKDRLDDAISWLRLGRVARTSLRACLWHFSEVATGSGNV